MKKNIFYIVIAGCLLLQMTTGCKKSDFKDNYYNPETSVNSTMEGLYGGLFNNLRVRDRYWALFTYQVPMLGMYSQTTGYLNGTKRYEQAVNYTQDQWNDYYTSTLASFREMEKKYATYTDDAGKKGYQLFMETAKIFLYDQTAQMIDLWGDIPFTEAGQLNSTGSLVYAKYDKGKETYDFLIADLKRIADYLATVQPDAFYSTQLQKTDYINNGDITKWRKYCNSLRLRLAMRISYVDETKAKTVVQEILGNSTQYPIITAVSDNIQIVAKGPNLLAITNQHERGIQGGMEGTLAPGYMLDSVMKPSADPRLRIFFSKNKNGQYFGVPTGWNSTRQTDSVSANFFSRYDSVTFSRNDFFPTIILTAAEVNFIKAEAYERWGGGTAKTAYEDGIKRSIEYYYSIHKLSGYGTQKPEPAALEITTFLANPTVAYTLDKPTNLARIATQNWINFGVIQNYLGWTELRRTKYPAVTFLPDPGSTLSPNVPTRLLYPAGERVFNPTNYNEVKAADNVTTKIFWDVR
ncbi:MAG TPA: SusD/RagB family nutrient-binding outer membrane lipoprotein [Chitinophagaceae bacterium]